MTAMVPQRPKTGQGWLTASRYGGSAALLLLRSAAAASGGGGGGGGGNGGEELSHAGEATEALCEVLADPEAVDRQLRRGADPDAHACSWSGATALTEAARGGLTPTVKLLLDRGANSASTDRGGFTALMSAAIGGYTSTAKLLVDRGASVNTSNNDGFTALTLGAYAGHRAIVNLLKHSGAKIQDSADSRNGLRWFAAYGNASQVGLLLDCGASVSATDSLGRTILMLAARHGQAATVKLLLDRRANINAVANNSFTALRSAAHGGHEKTAKVLLDYGANDTDAALLSAARHGYASLAKMVLDRGANISTVTTDGHDSLQEAAIGGFTPLVELLLDRGANVSRLSPYGWPALFSAASHGHTPSVKLLLDHGSNITFASPSGKTALFLAARGGHLSSTKTLLQRGAKLGTVVDDGSTPLIEAARNGHAPVLKVLFKNSANTNATDKDIRAADNLGRTALHYAAQKGLLEAVTTMVQRAPDVRFVKDLSSQTPLDLAVSNSQFELLPVLPPETTQEACQRLLERPETIMLALAACIFACLLAVWNGLKHNKTRDKSTASRGARLLAEAASSIWCTEAAFKIFRTADIFAASVLLARCMHTFELLLSVPTIVLLYVAPAIALGGFTTALDLAAGLSAMPASVLAAQTWRPRKVAACAVGTLRLVILACLMALLSRSDLGAGSLVHPWGLVGVDGPVNNPNSGILMPSPLSFDISRWAAWRKIQGDCRVDKDGCISSAEHYPACRVGAPQYGMAQVIGMANSGANTTCHTTIYVNGVQVHAKGAEGFAPRGDFQVAALQGCRICPAPGKIAILTPTVGELWTHWYWISLGVCLLALLSSAGLALKAALSQGDCGSGGSSGWGKPCLVEDRTSEREALAERIDDIAAKGGTAEETHAALQELRGAGRAVRPETPCSVCLALALVALEVLLHLCCVVILVTNEEIYGAGCLMVALVYSAASQLYAGCFRWLCSELADSARAGRWSDRLLAASDRHRGGGSVLALLATSYGLPLAAKTPLQAMLGMLSILVGCHGIGNYLFMKVDVEGSHGSQRHAKEDSGEEEEADVDGEPARSTICDEEESDDESEQEDTSVAISTARSARDIDIERSHRNQPHAEEDSGEEEEEADGDGEKESVSLTISTAERVRKVDIEGSHRVRPDAAGDSSTEGETDSSEEEHEDSNGSSRSTSTEERSCPPCKKG